MNDKNARIKELRLACGLSQDAFANKLGLKSRGKIANLEFGKTEADKEFTDLICYTFNANKEWLETGNGEMFAELSKEEYIAEFVGRILKDKEDSLKRRYVAMLSKLDEDGWAALEKVASAMGQINKD